MPAAPPSPAFAIDVTGVTKRFGGRKTVVNAIDLQVRRGEIFGFLGPNGSGKTTFIRMLCGLLTPDAGSGTCLGYDVRRQQDEIKRHVGYMTQRFSYYEDLSIRENLDFIARVYAVPDRRQAVARSLERLGLANRSHQLAGELSGGWKQRLALAACLIHAAAAPARRTHRGRRSQGAARFLGRDSPAGRRGADGAHHHALHGRSRALPSPRLPRVRQPAHPRHGRRGRRAPGISPPGPWQARPPPYRARTARPRRRGAGRRLRQYAARERPRRRPRSTPRLAGATPRTPGPRPAASRTCSSA
jgi:ABC-type uncharacterized transport system YnjBCD ATPase subunit